MFPVHCCYPILPQNKQSLSSIIDYVTTKDKVLSLNVIFLKKSRVAARQTTVCIRTHLHRGFNSHSHSEGWLRVRSAGRQQQFFTLVSALLQPYKTLQPFKDSEGAHSEAYFRFFSNIWWQLTSTFMKGITTIPGSKGVAAWIQIYGCHWPAGSLPQNYTRGWNPALYWS